MYNIPHVVIVMINMPRNISQITNDDLKMTNSRIESDEPEDTDDDDLELFTQVVCFTCPYLDQCGVGGEYSPVTCVWFRDWLNNSVQIYEDEYEYINSGDEEGK